MIDRRKHNTADIRFCSCDDFEVHMLDEDRRLQRQEALLHAARQKAHEAAQQAADQVMKGAGFDPCPLRLRDPLLSEYLGPDEDDDDDDPELPR